MSAALKLQFYIFFNYVPKSKQSGLEYSGIESKQT